MKKALDLLETVKHMMIENGLDAVPQSLLKKAIDKAIAQLEALDEKIERLTIRLKLIKEWSDVNEKIINDKDKEIKELGEIVQQYLIPSKNYDAIIRDKDKEIVKLKLELFRSSPKIANKKTRSIVAMLFWEWRKHKRMCKFSKFGSYLAMTHLNNATLSKLIFDEAYAMLKDKQ